MVKAEDLLVSAPSDRNKKPWIDIGAAVTTDNGMIIFNLKIYLKKLSLYSLSLFLREHLELGSYIRFSLHLINF